MAEHKTPRRQIGFPQEEFAKQDRIARAAGHRSWADATRLIILDGYRQLAGRIGVGRKKSKTPA
jgi:hypothetical protein